MLELLHLVPEKEPVDEAKLLMEGLTTLRPSVLQPLLENCHSVKAKRLFLSLAESSGHAWLGELDLARIALGKGKHVLVKNAKGGRLDAKYQVVLPVSRDEPGAARARLMRVPRKIGDRPRILRKT